MDIATLITVDSVLSERSVRGAARRMRRPVASVAAALSRMESAISVQLIQKAGNGIVLTLEAERLAPSIRQLAGCAQKISAIGGGRQRDVSLSLVSLERFIQVSEAGSIRRAARQLGVGQPQLARQMAHMEAALGCRLLQRSVNGATVTPTGRHLVQAIRELNIVWHDVAHAAAGRSRRTAATIRLGSIIPMGHDSFVATLLASLVAAWMEDKPRQPLFVASNTTEELIAGLKSGMFHSVLLNSVGIPAEFDAHLIARSPLSLIGNVRTVGSNGDAGRIADVLRGARIVLPSPKSGLRQIVSGLLETTMTEEERDALDIVDLDSMPVILNLVARHGAVSIVPSESLSGLGGSLAQIPLSPEYFLPHWLVCAKNESGRESMRAILTVLERLGYGGQADMGRARDASG